MALHQSKIYRALDGDMRKLDSFCEAMAAGRSARDLIAWVVKNCADEVGAKVAAEALIEQNVTDFRQGYYARWVRARETSRAIRERAAASSQLIREARAGGASIAEAAEIRAADMLSEALDTFDVDSLRGLLAESPDKFLSIVEKISRLAANETLRRAQVAQARKLEEEIATLRQRRQHEAAELRRKITELQKALAAKASTPETLAAPVGELAALIERMVANG